MADAQRRRRDYALGLFFILCVGLLWSASSILVQWIYADLEFDSPFFVTYLSNLLFGLYLPLWAGGLRWVSCGIRRGGASARTHGAC